MNRVWFGALWLVLFYLPPLIINWEGIYYEHRSYVPLAGVLLIVAEIRGPFWNRTILRYRHAAGALVMGLFVALSVIDLNYSEAFRESERFWQNAVRTSPHSFLAASNFAATHTRSGKFDQALQWYKKAAMIRPDDSDARCRIADQLLMLGRREDAVGEYKEALRINPANRYAAKKINDLRML